MDNTRMHHPLSPSNWPAWAKCPHFQGGVRSAASDNGTDQHEAYANAVKSGAVDEFDEAGAAWAARETLAMAGGAEVCVEHRVDIGVSFDGTSVSTYGYVDASFVRDGVLHVVDFKSGRKTEVDYWPQLEGYAIGCAANASYPHDKPVVLHLLYGGDFTHDAKDTTVAECIADAKLVLAGRIYRTEADRATCHQCRWCANRASCPASQTAIANVETDTCPAVALPDAVLLDRFAVIEGIIKAERERIRNAAIANGGVVESGGIRYEMREAAGTRKSVDIPAVWNDAVKLGIDLTQDELMAVCDLGKKDFVDLVKARAKAAGVKVKDVEAAYNSHVERNPPTQKLVRVASNI